MATRERSRFVLVSSACALGSVCPEVARMAAVTFREGVDDWRPCLANRGGFGLGPRVLREEDHAPGRTMHRIGIPLC